MNFSQASYKDLLKSQEAAVLGGAPPPTKDGTLLFVVVRCYKNRVLIAPQVGSGVYETVPGYMAGDSTCSFGFALGWSEVWPIRVDSQPDFKFFDGATPSHQCNATDARVKADTTAGTICLVLLR